MKKTQPTPEAKKDKPKFATPESVICHKLGCGLHEAQRILKSLPDDVGRLLKDDPHSPRLRGILQHFRNLKKGGS